MAARTAIKVETRAQTVAHALGFHEILQTRIEELLL